MNTSRFFAVCLFVLMLVSGFLQERLKISLNFYLEQSTKIPGFFENNHEWRAQEIERVKNAVHAPYDYYWSHSQIYFYNYLSYKNLVVFKWALALAFILITFFLSRLILKYWFAQDARKAWLNYIFLAVLALIVLISGLSYLLGFSDKIYPVLRELLGIVQSPVPLLVVGVLSGINKANPNQLN